MVPIQCDKFVNVIPPVAIVDDASWTTTEIDTLGYDYLTVICNLGVTDIAMAALKLQSSDTTGANFTDVAGLDMDGDTDIDGNTAALPAADDDGTVHVFQVDLRGHKRFFDLVATAGDGTSGTFMSAVAVLSRGEIGADSSTEMGAAHVLRI